MADLGVAPTLGAADVPTVNPAINPAEAARIANPADRAAVMGGLPQPAAQQSSREMILKDIERHQAELGKRVGEVPPPPTDEQAIQGEKIIGDVISQRNAQADAIMPKPPKPYTEEDWNIHPKQAEAFLPLMMAMAALSGSKSGSPMIGALNSMNSVMEAQISGNKEFADHHYQQMKEQYSQAKDQYNAQIEAVKPILKRMAAGSPESNHEIRMALLEHHVPASQVEQLMTGDANSNNLQRITGLEKYISTAEGKIAELDKAKEANESRESIAKAREGVGAQPIDQKTVDFYAEQSLSGDNSWQVGLARGKVGQKLISAVKDRIPEMAAMRNMSPQDATTNKAVRDSLNKSLIDRTKYVAAGTQYVNNFNKQSELVEKYLSPGVGGSTPIFNRWIQAGRKQIKGDAEVSALDTAIRGLAREHQRIVSGVTSNAQLHASAQDTADQLLNISQTEGQIRANLKEMREEAQNALQSGNDEVSLLKTQLKHVGGAEKSVGNGSAESPIHLD